MEEQYIVDLLPAALPPPPLNTNIIAKGKRTKRQRPTTTRDFSSSSDSDEDDESTTTEEIDTARCLILLSRGVVPPPNNTNRNSSSNKAVAIDGSCVYTCKTCNRSFPSFQALGGHRTSHKKPRNNNERRPIDEDDFSSPSSKFRLSLHLNNNNNNNNNNNLVIPKSSPSPRMHECSYCGAEFTSGQALGGHMRKHRAGPIIRSPEKPGKFGLSLDLNFPAAPEDDKVKSPQETTNQRLRLGFSHHHYSTNID